MINQWALVASFVLIAGCDSQFDKCFDAESRKLAENTPLKDPLFDVIQEIDAIEGGLHQFYYAYSENHPAKSMALRNKYHEALYDDSEAAGFYIARDVPLPAVDASLEITSKYFTDGLIAVAEWSRSRHGKKVTEYEAMLKTLPVEICNSRGLYD